MVVLNGVTVSCERDDPVCLAAVRGLVGGRGEGQRQGERRGKRKERVQF